MGRHKSDLNDEAIILALLALLAGDNIGKEERRYFSDLLKDESDSLRGFSLGGLVRELLVPWEYGEYCRSRDKLLSIVQDRFRQKENWDRGLDRVVVGLVGSVRRNQSFFPVSLRMERHLSELEDKNKDLMWALESKISSVDKRQDEHEETSKSNQADLHSLFWLLNSGADFSKIKQQQYVPARIYISDPVPKRKQLEKLKHNVDVFVSSFDMVIADDIPEEKGSWWKKFYYKTKEALTSEDVMAQVRNAEAVLKLKHFEKPRAEANLVQAQAASEIIKSLESASSACIQVGSLLVVKSSNINNNSSVFVRTLSTEELREIEENQSILGKPNEILAWLDANKI